MILMSNEVMKLTKDVDELERIDEAVSLSSVNVFQILQDSLEHDFGRGSNEIGCSEVTGNPRAVVIGRLKGIRFGGNMKTLHGTILHEAIQKPESLSLLLSQMCDVLDIDISVLEVVPEYEMKVEVGDGLYLGAHVDVYTNQFLVEIKTTTIYQKYWEREVAPYQALQLNTYMGMSGVHKGYILKFNTTAFQSKAATLDKIWRNYGYILPVVYDAKLYEETLRLAKDILEGIRDERWDHLECPVLPWGCKYCDPKIKKTCGLVR